MFSSPRREPPPPPPPSIIVIPPSVNGTTVPTPSQTEVPPGLPPNASLTEETTVTLPPVTLHPFDPHPQLIVILPADPHRPPGPRNESFSPEPTIESVFGIVPSVAPLPGPITVTNEHGRWTTTVSTTTQKEVEPATPEVFTPQPPRPVFNTTERFACTSLLSENISNTEFSHESV